VRARRFRPRVGAETSDLRFLILIDLVADEIRVAVVPESALCPQRVSFAWNSASRASSEN
jgi:hypothetical protein